jgi:DNA-binding NtrC family response regulator
MQVSKFMLLQIRLQHYNIFVTIAKYSAVLVSDIRMPALTRFQLVGRVKDLRPEMKVIMMTMFEVNKREFEAVFPSIPIDGVKRKPFTPSHLVEKIQGFLGMMAQGTTRHIDGHKGSQSV